MEMLYQNELATIQLEFFCRQTKRHLHFGPHESSVHIYSDFVLLQQCYEWSTAPICVYLRHRKVPTARFHVRLQRYLDNQIYHKNYFQ